MTTIDLNEADAKPPGGTVLYDPRIAANGYGQISLAMAGVAVTAITVALTLGNGRHPTDTTFAMGLLGAGFGASVVGAALFFAIHSEGEVHHRHYTTSMLTGLITGLGVIAIFGAFEALSAGFLPSARPTFLIVLSGMAVVVAAFVNTLPEDWHRRFGEIAEHDRRLPQSSAQARAIWLYGTWGVMVVIVTLLVIRHFGGHVSLSSNGSTALVAAAFGLVIVLALQAIRLLYEDHAPPTTRMAWTTNAILTGWVGVLVFFLP